jgi:hypothetical protein
MSKAMILPLALAPLSKFGNSIIPKISKAIHFSSHSSGKFNDTDHLFWPIVG